MGPTTATNYLATKIEDQDKVLPIPPQTPRSSFTTEKSSPQQEPTNVQIKGYEILAKLGQGGMGTVYKAHQISMQRTVAIKVLSNQNVSENQIQRFVKEARSVAKLNHENIITGIDAGSNDQFYYFVMEYVEGENVAQMLEKGEIAPQKSI